jgi:iron complex outermembrane receptor protein/vitamin B12 transporter
MHIAANQSPRRNKRGTWVAQCGFVVKALTVFFIAIGWVLSACAQRQKSLHGTVHDPLGSVVAGASVELLREDKVIASAKTNPDGAFRFEVPASQRYRIRVSAATFETTTTAALYVAGPGDEEADVTLATQTLTQQVTVTATGTPTPEAQLGASVTVLNAGEYRYMPEVQAPLRLIPGLQVTQTGQMGGTTRLSIRGGETDANKVLIDGVPANTIGGGVEFANLASVGIESIEVLREPNSALYGSDALAGVVSLNSVRGATPLPLVTYAGDAGNFHTYRNEGTVGTSFHRFDLYSAFARIDTSNNLPNSEFHNATYAGNFGWKPNAANELRFTVRHILVSGGQPNSIVFDGIADDAVQTERDNYYGAVWDNQTTSKWHNQIRYGGLRQNGSFNSGPGTGIPDGFGDYDGTVVTITGANGYSVTGQAAFQFPPRPSQFLTPANRDFIYAQTDYRVGAHFLALGGFKYENESGSSGYSGASSEQIQRGNYSYTLQFSGDLHNRLFYNFGTGLEDNGLFGFAGTPRASLAYYLMRPSGSGLFSGTKLHGSFGKGIKEPSIFQQTNSLYGDLPAGSPLITEFKVHPLGPENSRTFDAGLDQQLLNGRARIGITYFHNQFTNGAQDVPQAELGQFGVAPTLAANFPFGAYLNGGAFRALGAELEAEYRVNNHLFARGGYTYTDAVVQQSVATPATFTSFPNIAIGAYAPLPGARPFRVAPHTGYFGLTYTHSKFYSSLTGTLVGKRDDSDFLFDSNFGNSLLLPNRNLLGSYERLEAGGGYQLTPRINLYANVQNLLSEHYYEAFGFPSLPMSFRTGIKLNFGGENWKLN